MKIKDTEIKVVRGDITELKVDAIVNAANNRLVMGGGLALAIKRKGGKVIEEEAVKKGPIEIGGAVVTGAGNLCAKYVIHTATMGMDFKTDEIKIRESCRNALKLAVQLRISSVALPALGCGVGGFPFKASAKIMAQEVFRNLKENQPRSELQDRGDASLKEIIFCLYDQQAYEVFQKNVLGYLDYIVNKLKSPYVTVDAIIEMPVSSAGGPFSFEQVGTVFPAGGPVLSGDGGSICLKQTREVGIVIIKRSNPPFGWALPGGFVDYGESLEQAVTREVKEETGLDITEIRQFHTYSQLERDPRFHTVSTVFIVRAEGKAKAGDDALELRIVKLTEIEKLDFAFDHKKILEDYILSKQGK